MRTVKKCYMCGDLKPLAGFYRSKRDGHSSRCKQCEKLYNHERYMRDKHQPCVYYYPEMHYVGVTQNISRRHNEHKSHDSFVGDFEILCYFHREVDAVWLETMFHQRGYNGYRKL